MGETTELTTGRVTTPVAFDLRPGDAAREAIATRLELLGLRKLRFHGSVVPSGARDLTLQGELGATVTQACVVTGDPVTTRIDVPVLRTYLTEMEMPTADETEMPDDENAEPMPATIDLAAVMEEALVIALPDWPRAEGVEPVDLMVTEPGVTPMTDEDAKPFAELKALRDRMAERDGEQ